MSNFLSYLKWKVLFLRGECHTPPPKFCFLGRKPQQFLCMAGSSPLKANAGKCTRPNTNHESTGPLWLRQGKHTPQTVEVRKWAVERKWGLGTTPGPTTGPYSSREIHPSLDQINSPQLSNFGVRSCNGRLPCLFILGIYKNISFLAAKKLPGLCLCLLARDCDLLLIHSHFNCPGIKSFAQSSASGNGVGQSLHLNKWETVPTS